MKKIISTILILCFTLSFCSCFNSKTYKFKFYEDSTKVVSIKIFYCEIDGKYTLLKDVDLSYVDYIYETMESLTYTSCFSNGHWDHICSYIIELTYSYNALIEKHLLKNYCPYGVDTREKRPSDRPKGPVPYRKISIQNVNDYIIFHNMVINLLNAE